MSRLIIEILEKEEDLLKKLLSLLEEQHEAVVKNDIEAMNEIVNKLVENGKKIENAENQRRKITGEKTINEMIAENGELDEKLRNIKKVVSEINVQKKTNTMLLKQGINFNNKVINILDPRKGSKVYDNSGKLSK